MNLTQQPTIYKINEIFYSIQGEGAYCGTPAIFIRFSGCNFHCHFCDTKHQTFTEMSEDDIVREITKFPANLIILTGGEPMLQVTRHLLIRLKDMGHTIAMETNGSIEITGAKRKYIDWVTISPKTLIAQKECDEFKFIMQENTPISIIERTHIGIKIHHFKYIQPEAGSQIALEKAVEYVKNNPEWKLSAQLHKLIGVQ